MIGAACVSQTYIIQNWSSRCTNGLMSEKNQRAPGFLMSLGCSEQLLIFKFTHFQRTISFAAEIGEKNTELSTYLHKSSWHIKPLVPFSLLTIRAGERAPFVLTSADAWNDEESASRGRTVRRATLDLTPAWGGSQICICIVCEQKFLTSGKFFRHVTQSARCGAQECSHTMPPRARVAQVCITPKMLSQFFFFRSAVRCAKDRLAVR